MQDYLILLSPRVFSGVRMVNEALAAVALLRTPLAELPVLPRPQAGLEGSGRDGKRRKRRREGKSRMWPPLPLHPPLLALASRSASGSDGTVESTGPDFIVPIYRGVICFVATVHGWPRLLGRTDGALRSSAKSLHFPDDDPIASS